MYLPRLQTQPSITSVEQHYNKIKEEYNTYPLHYLHCPMHNSITTSIVLILSSVDAMCLPIIHFNLIPPSRFESLCNLPCTFSRTLLTPTNQPYPYWRPLDRSNLIRPLCSVVCAFLWWFTPCWSNRPLDTPALRPQSPTPNQRAQQDRTIIPTAFSIPNRSPASHYLLPTLDVQGPNRRRLNPSWPESSKGVNVSVVTSTRLNSLNRTLREFSFLFFRTCNHAQSFHVRPPSALSAARLDLLSTSVNLPSS